MTSLPSPNPTTTELRALLGSYELLTPEQRTALDRATFERRFVARLRDPAFRRAAEPDSARYPSWDRILHPEKYRPKDAPVK